MRSKRRIKMKNKNQKPRVLVLTGFGINCDRETQYCFEKMGAEAERIHLNQLIQGEKKLEDYHILVIPGGFSFGDDIASATVLANKIQCNIWDQLKEFIQQRKLVLGICNGFQVLVKLGLLPGFNGKEEQLSTLTYNDSGRFEDRWVYLKTVPGNPCVFTRGLKGTYLPVRHGEGKFTPKDDRVLNRLSKNRQIVFRYVDSDGNRAGYPWNPNGSVDNIAGICDPTGRIFGLMPHPEAYNHYTNHPRWTRISLGERGGGLDIFENGINWVRSNLMDGY